MKCVCRRQVTTPQTCPVHWPSYVVRSMEGALARKVQGGAELVDVSEAVVETVWAELTKSGGASVARAIPVALLARIAPLVEALLRERIGSFGDLRGEVID
jgi:hypothetical protein